MLVTAAAASCTFGAFSMDEPAFVAQAGGGAGGRTGAEPAGGDAPMPERGGSSSAAGEAGFFQGGTDNGGSGGVSVGGRANDAGAAGDGGTFTEGGSGGEAGAGPCDPSVESCEEPCDSGAVRCRLGSSAERERCEAGVWQPASSCPAACTGDGECTGDCAPGSKKCEAGTPWVCGDDATWAAKEACPFVCTGAGVCTGSCKPGDTRCSSAGAKGGWQTCGADGNWLNEQACVGQCSQGKCHPTARVDLLPLGASDTSGTATLEQVGASVTLSVVLKDCPPGKHEVDFHAFASCGAYGADAGGHWPPGQQVGQVLCGADGKGALTFTAPPGAWAIGGGGDDDILSHALIVHQSVNPTPLGRIACGVPLLD